MYKDSSDNQAAERFLADGSLISYSRFIASFYTASSNEN